MPYKSQYDAAVKTSISLISYFMFKPCNMIINFNTIIGKLKKLIKNPHHGRGGDIPQILAPWVETAIT